MCVVDEHSYTLRDAEAEVLFGFSLEDSLKRAHNAPLFKVRHQVCRWSGYSRVEIQWGMLWWAWIGSNECVPVLHHLSVCLMGVQGKYFYLTPGMCPSLSTMKPILESAGGKLLAKQPSYRKIMEHKQNKVLTLSPHDIKSLQPLGGRDVMKESWLCIWFSYKVEYNNIVISILFIKIIGLLLFTNSTLVCCSEPPRDHLNLLRQRPAPL